MRKIQNEPSIANYSLAPGDLAPVEQNVIDPANHVDKCQVFAQVLCYCPRHVVWVSSGIVEK
jgi:hypothetical protein